MESEIMKFMKKRNVKKNVGVRVPGRQGDVLLVRVKALPKDAVAKPGAGDRVVLAYGEATGHHHSLKKTEGVRLYEGAGGATLLEVADALALLEHQEHAAIPLEAGVYEVRLQREYHPKEIRRVAD